MLMQKQAQVLLMEPSVVTLISWLLCRLGKKTNSLSADLKYSALCFKFERFYFQRSLNVLCIEFALSSEQIQPMSLDQVHILFSTI